MEYRTCQWTIAWGAGRSYVGINNGELREPDGVNKQLQTYLFGVAQTVNIMFIWFNLVLILNSDNFWDLNDFFWNF
jgi:hypothetical protein